MDNLYPIPYLMLLVINCAIVVSLTYRKWRGHYASLTLTFIGIMALTLLWSVGQFFELVSSSLEAKFFWVKVQAVGGMGLSVTWYLFVLRQTAQMRSFDWQRVLTFYLLPMVSLLLAWTNEWHGLVWAEVMVVDVGMLSAIEFTFGAWFWVQLAYSYIILALTVGLLFDTFRSSVAAYQRQAWVLSGAMFLPLLTNGLYFLAVTPFDFTPLATMMSGLVLVWGVQRVRLLDLMPIARNVVMEGVRDGVIIVDSRQRIVDVNPAGQHFLNSDIDTLIGHPIETILTNWPSDIHWPQLAHTPTRAHLTQQNDQERHNLDIEISPLYTWRKQPVGYLVVLHDVTQRYREEQLLNSEKQALHKLANGEPLEAVLTSLILALESQFPAMVCSIYLLDAIKQNWRLGAAPSLPLAYVNTLDGMAIDDCASCRVAVRTGEPAITVDISTDPLWQEICDLPLGYNLRACWSTPIISSEGEVLGSWAIYHHTPHIPTDDETQVLERLIPLTSIAIGRRLTETTLGNVLHFNETLLASVRDGIIVYGLDLRYQLWNKTMETMTGIAAEDVLGRHPIEVFPFLRENGFAERMEQALIGEQVKLDDAEYKIPETGLTGWYNALYAPHYDSAGEIIGVVATVQEVSERRNVELALRQTQKLESLGVLAGGVAHDFNNLLTGMLAQMSLTSIKLGEHSPLQKHVKQAVMAANQAADLTRQLLAYAGKGQFRVEALNFNKIVTQNTTLLKTSISKKVSLGLNLDSDLPLVEADRGQIQQVVMNLVINGAEAIELAAGRVGLRTWVSDGRLAGGFRQILSCGEGQAFVCLEVSDTGRGMDSATQERIFDPFFSTKTQGRGLGLSATLGIIRAHGGGLHVRSVVGEGTTFRVFFPAGASTSIYPTQETGPMIALAPIKTDKPLILVVDDEEPVRQAITDILTAVSLTVMTATNGLEGLHLFEKNQAHIGLVILDMQMPIMSGTEILAEIRHLAPDTKVLLSSGYTSLALPQEDSTSQHLEFLQKPYRLEELIDKVRSMLQA